MSEMNGSSPELRIDALIDQVVERRAGGVSPPGPALTAAGQDGALLQALSDLTAVDWPADEVGGRIAVHVAAAAVARPRRPLWLIAGSIAAAVILVAGIVALAGGSPRTGRPQAGRSTRPASASPGPRTSTPPGGTPASVTAMTIVSQPKALRAVGVLGSNSNFLYCSSRPVCYIQGYRSKNHPDIVRSDDGGATWTQGAALPFLPVTAPWNAQLTCPRPRTCFSGYQTGLIETRDGFAHFTFQPVTSPGSFVDMVSCPTVLHCVADVVGNNGRRFIYSADGGRSWAAATAPAVSARVTVGQISCSRDHCIALLLGGDERAAMVSALSSADGGQTWTEAPRFRSIGGQEEWRFDCGDGRHCVVTGNDGNFAWIDVTRSGAIDISTQHYPKGFPPSGDAVSCATGRDCFIELTNIVGGQDYTDNVIEVTRDFGRTWSAQIKTPIASVYLSCPVRAGCVAVAPKNPQELVVLSNLKH
jgi:hypothetical protein